MVGTAVSSWGWETTSCGLCSQDTPSPGQECDGSTDEEPSCAFPRGRALPASSLGVWSPGCTMLTWLVRLAGAGLLVPLPSDPSLVPGCLRAGWGWWGAALGRTSCLEAYRKGKSRCHLLSDQETQVSFPSARAGAWEAAPQGAAARCGTRKQFVQGSGVG